MAPKTPSALFAVQSCIILSYFTLLAFGAGFSDSSWYGRIRDVLPQISRPGVQVQPDRSTSKSDPRGRITCTGPLPPSQFPRRTFIQDNGDRISVDFTLQQICAKEEYGGFAFYNIGGWCDDGHSGTFPDRHLEADRRLSYDVVFDAVDAARSQFSRKLVRLHAYCQQRCHCTSQDDTPHKYKHYRHSQSYFIPEPEDIYQVNPDVAIFDQHKQPYDLDLNPVKRDRPPALQVKFVPQYGRSPQYTITDIPLLVLAESNRIECPGAVPEFDLPGGWRTFDIGDLQHMCANVMDGGWHHANAGLFCNVKGQIANVMGEPAVDASYEFIPALSWIPESYLPGNPTQLSDRLKAYALRQYCFSNCKCRSRSTTTSTTAASSPTAASIAQEARDGALVVDGKNARIVKVVTEDGQVQTRTYALTGETCSPPASGQKQQQCVEMLPEKYLPKAPVVTQTGIPPIGYRGPNDDATAPPTCGKQCSTYKDCQSHGEASDCRCVANPDPLLIKQIGVDPVATFALCLLTTGLVRKGSRVRLGGRSEAPKGSVERRWWEQPELPCPCNQTYVSRGCCDSPSGMVWEHKSFKLGSLR